MSQLPEIFNQQIGDVANPIEIREAFNSIRALVNSGIEQDNIKDGAVTDAKIGNRSIDDTVNNSTGTAAPITTILSQVGKQFKNITGKPDWFTPPTYTIDQIEQIADAANTKANAAVTTANDADDSANNATNIAASAVTVANTADENASTALVKATQVEEDYLNIKPEIEQAVTDAQSAAAAVEGKADVAYVNQVAADFTLGVVADGSITDAKLSNAAGQIKEAVTIIQSDLADTQEVLLLHKDNEILHISYATASGTDDYIATIVGITTLTEGLSLKIKFTNANTEAATLNINALGAKAIQKSNGGALSSGNIKAGQIAHLVYTGSVFQLLGEGGEYGTAGAAQVLAPYTVGTEEGIVTGTIPSKSAATITPGTVNQIISAGQFLEGAQIIEGSANLLPENIKNGVKIYEVTGSLPSGIKYASGVASTVYSGGTFGLSVSGLTFQPKRIIITVNGSGTGEGSFLRKTFDVDAADALNSRVLVWQPSTNTMTLAGYNSGGFGITPEGFVLSDLYQGTAYWYAYEK